MDLSGLGAELFNQEARTVLNALDFYCNRAGSYIWWGRDSLLSPTFRNTYPVGCCASSLDRIKWHLQQNGLLNRIRVYPVNSCAVLVSGMSPHYPTNTRIQRSRRQTQMPFIRVLQTAQRWPGQIADWSSQRGKRLSHLQDQVRRGLRTLKEQDPYIPYIAQINASWLDNGPITLSLEGLLRIKWIQLSEKYKYLPEEFKMD